MFGFLNIYKPRGLSSYDVIRRIKPLLPPDEKVGHAGTLDPEAQGVLMICLGPATRLSDWVRRYEKEYVTLATLGATSTTDDTDGQITARTNVVPPESERVAAAMSAFIGQTQQRPPAHSAVHVDGKRAYRMARAGQEVQIEPRPVTIYRIEILAYEYPRLRLKIRCASGTYIRALVRDVGEVLGTGAYCQEIIRTAIGPFRAEDALQLEELDRAGIVANLLPPAAAIPEEFRVALPADGVWAITRGQLVAWPALTDLQRQQSELAAVDAQGRLIALVKPLEDTLKPLKVFMREPPAP